LIIAVAAKQRKWGAIIASMPWVEFKGPWPARHAMPSIWPMGRRFRPETVAHVAAAGLASAPVAARLRTDPRKAGIFIALAGPRPSHAEPLLPARAANNALVVLGSPPSRP
jgi:hypothetical protein